MDEDNEKLLLCLRVSDVQNNSSVVDGSVQSNCRECEELVWVSVSGQKMVVDGAQIICNQCAEKMQEQEPQEMQITGEVIDEAIAQLLRDAGREGAEPLKVFNFITAIMQLPTKPHPMANDGQNRKKQES